MINEFEYIKFVKKNTATPKKKKTVCTKTLPKVIKVRKYIFS